MQQRTAETLVPVDSAPALGRHGDVVEELTAKVQSELAALIRHINDTRKSLANLHPDLNYAAESLPKASDALVDICVATEKATHNILTIVENLLSRDDALAPAIARLGALSEGDASPEVREAIAQVTAAHLERSDALTELMMQLSFQDLTSQTITKIGAMIRGVEERILALMLAIDPNREKEDGKKMESSGLARLQEAQAGTSRQDLVDGLLKAQGF